MNKKSNKKSTAQIAPFNSGNTQVRQSKCAEPAGVGETIGGLLKLFSPQDPVLEVRKVAEFLGRPIDQRAAEEIVHHTTFDEMKNNDMVNYSQTHKNGIIDFNISPFFRSGKSSSSFQGNKAVQTADLKPRLWKRRSAYAKISNEASQVSPRPT